MSYNAIHSTFKIKLILVFFKEEEALAEERGDDFSRLPVSVLIQARLPRMISRSVFPLSCSPPGVPLVLTGRAASENTERYFLVRPRLPPRATRSREFPSADFVRF